MRVYHQHLNTKLDTMFSEGVTNELQHNIHSDWALTLNPVNITVLCVFSRSVTLDYLRSVKYDLIHG